MTKRYSILQKKLEDLELEINHALSSNTFPCSAEIEQKFVFIANLLSAEIASHPSKPHHLHHIARRLSHLKAVFREAPTTPEFVNDASSCSCTESCLNDDGYADCLEGEKVEIMDFPGKLGDQEKGDEGVEFYDCHVVEYENKGFGVGMLCGAMAAGFLIGIAFMGVVLIKLCGCFLVDETHGIFFAPT